MTTYPLPLSATPASTDEATLQAAIDCLSEHLLLEMESVYTPKEVFAVLLRAASWGDSIEHTAYTLTGVPSSDDIRYHLDQYQDMATLEPQVNAALRSRIPLKIVKHSQQLAIDLNLIPFYGIPNAVEAPYIYRSQAKAGTTSFFAHATIYVICRNKRVTLGIHTVPQQETLVATITYLLAMLSPLRIRVKRVFLDRGFYSVPVIHWLKALNFPFLMTAIISGKEGGTRQRILGRISYATSYTLTSPQYGSVTCQMVVVCNYYKGFKGKHGIQYSLYVVYRVKVALDQLHHHYKKRFGIGTSYRIKNPCRIRTTTKNPVVRLLFFALAFILVNLWVYLLWHFVRPRQRGGRVVCRKLFGLKTMLDFLCHAVERHFPPIIAVYLPAPQ